MARKDAHYMFLRVRESESEPFRDFDPFSDLRTGEFEFMTWRHSDQTLPSFPRMHVVRFSSCMTHLAPHFNTVTDPLEKKWCETVVASGQDGEHAKYKNSEFLGALYLPWTTSWSVLDMVAWPRLNELAHSLAEQDPEFWAWMPRYFGAPSLPDRRALGQDACRAIQAYFTRYFLRDRTA